MTTTDPSDLTPQERVTRGARWLDEHGPADWWERIDYDLLNIQDPSACILGQVFAEAAVAPQSGYGYAALADLFEHHHPHVLGRKEVSFNGFCAVTRNDQFALREAWIEYIEERISVLSWLPEPVTV